MPMRPLYTAAQIRDIECAAAAGLPPGTLMRRAGLAAANAALELLADQPDPIVLVLAGPGNNGGAALRATHTITFIGDKPGLHTCEGQEHAGRVLVAPLDIGAAHYPPAAAQLNGPELFAACLRPRGRNAHKGSFGDLVVVGGAH